MEVILMERVEKLGTLGEVVDVKTGFARNFLLPQGKALRATKENLAHFEGQRKELEKKNAELKSEAEKLAEKIDGTELVVIRQAGDSGQLYGSVSVRDLADELNKQGHGIERQQVRIAEPIKTIGIFAFKVVLHAEVTVTLEANVAKSEDEAKKQREDMEAEKKKGAKVPFAGTVEATEEEAPIEAVANDTAEEEAPATEATEEKAENA